MLGIHINHTKPFTMKNLEKEYFIEDFNLLSTILSALKWREKNGRIKLYTDKIGYEFYQRNGLLSLWNGGIDTDTLENHKFNINFISFWAAGKLISIAREVPPFFMIDTDFICWEEMSCQIKDRNGVSVIHREELNESVYPNKLNLKRGKEYEYLNSFDWDEEPCNTAFAYFGDAAFKEYYLRESFRFMEGEIEKSSENITQMVFAEQRLFSMCAKELGIDIHSFLELGKLEKQNMFTHVWGYKDVLRKNRRLRKEFCKKCIRRIKMDFPEEFYLLNRVEALKEMLNEVERDEY